MATSKKTGRKASNRKDDRKSSTIPIANPTNSSREGDSLMESIFGPTDSTDKTTAVINSKGKTSTSTLFSKRNMQPLTSARQTISNKRKREENDKKCGGTHISKKWSKDTIIQRRQKQSKHPLLKNALDFPSAFLNEKDTKQDINHSGIELPLEEQVVEMADAVRQYGFCIIRKFLDLETVQDYLVPMVYEMQKRICAALDTKGICWRVPTSSDRKNDTEKATTIQQPEKFRFRDAASRCKGRLDIALVNDETHAHKQTPINQNSQDATVQQLLQKNPIFYSVVRNLLGASDETNLQLVYAGLIFNLPGSEDQPWHQDGEPLFPEASQSALIQANLPPYALNVFIPLEDSDGSLECGPTELLPGSHKFSAEQLEEVNDSRRRGQSKNAISPILKQGDVLIYDYRVCHRGTANLLDIETDNHNNGDKAIDGIIRGTRKILYLMFARKWFTDHLNFDSTKNAESLWTN